MSFVWEGCGFSALFIYTKLYAINVYVYIFVSTIFIIFLIIFLSYLSWLEQLFVLMLNYFQINFLWHAVGLQEIQSICRLRDSHEYTCNIVTVEDIFSVVCGYRLVEILWRTATIQMSSLLFFKREKGKKKKTIKKQKIESLFTVENEITRNRIVWGWKWTFKSILHY